MDLKQQFADIFTDHKITDHKITDHKITDHKICTYNIRYDEFR
jgi:hypothetical protein